MEIIGNPSALIRQMSNIKNARISGTDISTKTIGKEALLMGKNTLNVAGKFFSGVSGGMYIMFKNVFTDAQITEDDLDKPHGFC